MELEYKYEVDDTGYVLFKNKIRKAKIVSLDITVKLNFDGQYIQPNIIDNIYRVEFEDYKVDRLYEISEDRIYKTRKDLINDLREEYGR